MIDYLTFDIKSNEGLKNEIIKMNYKQGDCEYQVVYNDIQIDQMKDQIKSIKRFKKMIGERF